MDLHPAIPRVLALRGLRGADECRRFFDPQLSHFHDPFLLCGMEKAAERIIEAVKSRELVVVYGDYDVDGITATAMMVRFLRSIGGRCEYYLPNRLTEGYGLSMEGMEKIARTGCRLIITVDCGITACKEVERAAALGMDVVLTDHHEPKETLPAALVVMDPKVAACGYPDDSLAGVGVALKLCQALAARVDGVGDLWTEYLDIAAVGTAADIVQLMGENRTIAKLGLARLRATQNPGLKALMDAQGLSGKALSTSDVVFQIAPCINAVGRLGDARKSVELLLTDDPGLARRYAGELKQANMERRAIDKAMQEEAFACVESRCSPDRDYAIVLGSPAWHCGVLGIVASKVVERYHRPAILFSIDAEGKARGSGRSISALPLHTALAACGDLLENFGGHAAAAGMTIMEANLDAFRERFNEVVKASVTEDDFVPRIRADARIGLADCTYPFYNTIEKIAPFGPGNMRPAFLCSGLRHKYEPRVVGANHVKLMVAEGAVAMDAVGFNFGRRFDEIKKARSLSLAFTLDDNE
jgi:single-stranded-DNA-specific exonuclease